MAIRKTVPAPPQVSVDDALKTSGGEDTVYYQTQLRGVSNAKAKRELNFHPRPLEWIADRPVDHGSQQAVGGAS